MGLFDYIRYKGNQYQTRNTPAQNMEQYEIRAGELWYRKVIREWEDDDITYFGGYLREVSHEWVFCKDYDGIVKFYRPDEENGGYKADRWIEYRALFSSGKIIEFERINSDKAIS